MTRSAKYLTCLPALLAFVLTCNVLRPFFISEEDEIELGNKFKAEILADTENYPVYNGSQRIKNFIDSLGEHLVDVQTDRENLDFTFTIIDDDTMINAFAIPGGHVFVYTGLLAAAENTAEIAGVLAHEIGHITKYHGVNKLLQGSFVGYVNQIIFGDSSSIAEAVSAILENMAFMQLSQKDEYQADSCSVAYTTNAGINPVGMKHFLKTLRDRYGDTPKMFEPFSSHPSLQKRIENVQKLIDANPKAPADTTVELFRNEYQVIKATGQF